MSAPWDGIIPEETLDLYRRAGFAKASRQGSKPALLVIDVQYMTTGETAVPLADGLAYHPLNCGEHAWAAIAKLVPLIAGFRRLGYPVIYPYVAAPAVKSEQSRWPSDNSNSRFHEIVEQVAPTGPDILLPKTAPSAFFGTPLLKYLHSMRVDTLFVTGNTTSGCIRATTVDASSYEYNVIVPHDCCYDRSPVSHAVNLFDIASKYADVISGAAALKRLEAIGSAA